MNLIQLLRHYAGTREEEKEELPGLPFPFPERNPMRPESQPLASPDNRPEQWRDLFEERAGIMEFEGGLGRAQAEQEAERLLGGFQ